MAPHLAKALPMCANESNGSNDSTSESPVTDSSTIHEFGTSRFTQARAAARAPCRFQLLYRTGIFDKRALPILVGPSPTVWHPLSGRLHHQRRSARMRQPSQYSVQLSLR